MVKRTVLPRSFPSLLAEGDFDALTAVFLVCDVDARDRALKRTALAFDDCPDALARWLVDRGADLSARDARGDTPLHARSRSRRGRIEVLLDLGADPRAEGALGTPLHGAAEAFSAENARLLLSRGAIVDATDAGGSTPLERALSICRNLDLVRMSDLADVLLQAGARKGRRATEDVSRIGSAFEFHRAGFNPALVDDASAALDRLYALFDVVPVPRRRMHDGASPIVATAPDWQTRHRQLWDALVPPSGAATTVQGEVVRIAGRIAHELDGNGGGNWDAQHATMLKAWLEHLGFGEALRADLLAEATLLAASLPDRGEAERLCELSVAWVDLNPTPVALPPPSYER